MDNLNNCWTIDGQKGNIVIKLLVTFFGGQQPHHQLIVNDCCNEMDKDSDEMVYDDDDQGEWIKMSRMRKMLKWKKENREKKSFHL